MHFRALSAFLLLALPLEVLDASTVKRGEPVRSERGWRLSNAPNWKLPPRKGDFADPGGQRGGEHPSDAGRQSELHRHPCVLTPPMRPRRGACSTRSSSTTVRRKRRACSSPARIASARAPRQSASAISNLLYPHDTTWTWETQGGDITVEAPLAGDARLTTAGGDVRSSDLSGSVRIETAGGEILARPNRQRPECSNGGWLHPRGRCERRCQPGNERKEKSISAQWRAL